MKHEQLAVKTVLALFIVMFGMFALIFMDLKETNNNSIVNLMIMVVSYHFGSSSGSAEKDKVIQNSVTNPTSK